MRTDSAPMSQQLFLAASVSTAKAQAANMRGLPNEIARAEGFAQGLEEAYDLIYATSPDLSAEGFRLALAEEATHEAIARVWFWHDKLVSATTLPQQADSLRELSNAVADLASWHPDCDEETGRIDGVNEDDS